LAPNRVSDRSKIGIYGVASLNVPVVLSMAQRLLRVAIKNDIRILRKRFVSGCGGNAEEIERY